MRYDFAAQLKQDFPGFTIVTNGGIATPAGVEAQLAHADGVMIGRQAYHDPWWLAEVDARWFGLPQTPLTREQIAQQMAGYAAAEIARGAQLRSITRHMLGLFQGMPGARAWRRMLSDSELLARNDPQLIIEAAALTVPLPLAA